MIALAAVGLLAVLVGFTVPALLQLRRTARALENFLEGVTPRIESATSNLDSVLGRMDRVMRGMEDGTRGITGALGSAGAFLSNLRPPAAPGGGASSWLAALSALLSGLWQAWSALASAPARPAGPGPAAAPQGAGAAPGGSHD
jgi:hypothetical protein